MNSGSLHLGSLFGVRVTIHWSVAVIAMVLATSLSGATGWGYAILGVVTFMASILVHEFAHALTARRFDVETESIQLWALGGLARLRSEPATPRAEGWIAAAGPLASAALAAALTGGWIVARAAGAHHLPWSMLLWLALVNALLAAFNLLPGAPLDGGRIVKAVRWARHGNRYRAAREAGRAGQVVAWVVSGVGFLLLVRDSEGVFLLLTGIFMLAASKMEIATADIGERLDGITVGDLTWYGVAHAGPDMDADSMLWQRSRLGSAGGVAVTDELGGLQGLVLEDQMWSVPADERPWVLLTKLMIPFDHVAHAAPEESLMSVLPRLDPRRPAIAVWSGDRLIGLVNPARVRERLELARR